MGRRKGQTYDLVMHPRSVQPLIEQGAAEWAEVERLRSEIRPGDMFRIPSTYYCEGMGRVEVGMVVEAHVTEAYPHNVLLVRHAPHGDVPLCPPYQLLLQFERRYGSGRRPLWD